MPSYQPSRRHLLSGLVASLFGWLGAGKAPAKAPPPPAFPSTTVTKPQAVSTTISRYDSDGGFITSIDYPGGTGLATYSYNGQGRLTQVTDPLPPINPPTDNA